MTQCKTEQLLLQIIHTHRPPEGVLEEVISPRCISLDRIVNSTEKVDDQRALYLMTPPCGVAYLVTGERNQQYIT